jgi:hypothetical protein
MRSGPIRPEARTTEVDRRGECYALWEEEVPGALVNLPWDAASSLAAKHVAPLLSTARTAHIVVGRARASYKLLEHALNAVPPSCRLYVYASHAWEPKSKIRQKLKALADRVSIRLGFDAPADWLVVDAGRTGLLLLGPPEDKDRRWIVPADGTFARTLHGAFRVLFRFYAAREGMPDGSGAYAFRTPLPAPFPSPWNVTTLPSGRLVIGEQPPDPVPDAKIRIVPNGAVTGRAEIVFMRPNGKDFVTPMKLARSMTEVVWTDTGLPSTTVTLERAVLDLVNRPISLQVEWPRKDAIDIYHRLSKAAQKPEWRFHPQRRLSEVRGRVILEGATHPVQVQVKDSEEISAPDVVLPIEDFDRVPSDVFPNPPPLVRRVIYKWTALPEALPAGAREAELVRKWRAVDEWARRQVDTLRQALERMEKEERGFIDRLRPWFSGYDDLRQRRNQLGGRLVELGEASPSQRDDACELVRRIIETTREVRELIEHAHATRLRAEDSAAEAHQKAEWEAGVRRALEELAAKRSELRLLKEREAEITSELREAEERSHADLEVRREARRVSLLAKRDRVSAELEAARREQGANQGGPKLQPEEGARKIHKLGWLRRLLGRLLLWDERAREEQAREERARKIHNLKRRLRRLNLQIEGLDAWFPPPKERTDELAALFRLREAWKAAHEAVRAADAEIQRLELIAGKPFAFKAPPQAPAPAVPQDSANPSIPDEAGPELGDLFEHGGQRYLAVKTWEQARLAVPVAQRLKAKLVCFGDQKK